MNARTALLSLLVAISLSKKGCTAFHIKLGKADVLPSSSSLTLFGAYSTGTRTGITDRDEALLNRNTKHKIASSIAKGERRAQERNVRERRELCERCRRPPVQCVCESLPSERILTDTTVLILQHPTEFRRKTFSTVPLIPLVLQNVQIYVGHSFDLETPPIRDALANGNKLLLLFPGPDAITLDDLREEGQNQPVQVTTETENCGCHDEKGGPKANSSNRNLLILIDGTWTQARRMARNSPALLQNCQQVQFTSENNTSIYDAVRKEPESHCLSTLEACAKTLLLLEPRETARLASDHLHAALQSLVDTQLRYTSALADPRFVGGKTKVLKRKQRRLELERELFGEQTDENDKEEEASAAQCTDNSPHDSSINTPHQFHRSPRKIVLDEAVILKTLSISDAPFIDSRWPHRSQKSLAMISRRLQSADSSCCLGIYSETNGSLRAFLLQYENGALGMLHVEEEYRRKGYATALLQQATLELEKRKDPLFAYILDGNTASETLFTKHGWVRADPSLKRGTGKRRAKRKWVLNYSLQ